MSDFMFAGNIPLLLLARSVSMNMHNTQVIQELALNSVHNSKAKPIDWSLADADGNTVLHLLFSTDEPENVRRRYGKLVQTFARALTLQTPQHRQLLSHMDLLCKNKKGQSVMRLIAEHCLRPRSMRATQSEWNFWALHESKHEYDRDTLRVERFPDTRNTAEQLHSTWIRERLPLARSGTLALCKSNPLSGPS